MISSSKQKQLFLPILLLVALLSACSSDSTPPPPPKKVEVQVVQPQSFLITSELPGRVEPMRIAEVRARVAGIVLSRNFEEGADVKAGQVLFRIDPAPFKVALSRAQGELAKAEAAMSDAGAIVRRFKPLVEIEAVSQQDFDTAQATYKSTQAARRSAQADIETALLNLDYATVKAPISGRIGRAQVSEGALVGQGDATVMATIQQLAPIYVDFTQSVGDVLRTRDALADGRLTKGKDGNTGISITIDGTDHKREGRLMFADIGVDRTTSQVTLRGKFTNEDNLLLPGMYVRVLTDQGVDPEAILVPQRAVIRSTDGKAQVLVVNKDDVVEARLVQTGTMRGSEWHILKGLQAGDRVIVGGGKSVNPNDKVIPEVAVLKTAEAARQ